MDAWGWMDQDGLSRDDSLLFHMVSHPLGSYLELFSWWSQDSKRKSMKAHKAFQTYFLDTLSFPLYFSC